ncbi:MAG: PilZ domain-containing protein, partial [Pseudomonadota bacterium]
MTGVIMNEVDNRQFIRHPSNIPIEYCFVDRPLVVSDSTNNVSAGGLSFRANQYIEPNSWLQLHIPIHHEYVEIDARVLWCQPGTDNAYDWGVMF